MAPTVDGPAGKSSINARSLGKWLKAENGVRDSYQMLMDTKEAVSSHRVSPVTQRQPQAIQPACLQGGKVKVLTSGFLG